MCEFHKWTWWVANKLTPQKFTQTVLYLETFDTDKPPTYTCTLENCTKTACCWTTCKTTRNDKCQKTTLVDIFRGKHYAYVTLDLASVIVFVLFDSKAKIDFLSEKNIPYCDFLQACLCLSLIIIMLCQWLWLWLWLYSLTSANRHLL